MKKVAVIMGSDSDWPVMSKCADQLKKFGLPYEVSVLSAHRCADATANFVKKAKAKGFGVIIAAAGGAAHLAGAAAAHTTLPVIGVPMAATPLAGFDALLATVQMPPGVPVATVAVGDFGAVNAAVLAAQILAVGDPTVAKILDDHKKSMREGVRKKNVKLQKAIKGEK